MTEIRCDFDGPLPRDLAYRVRRLVQHQGWTIAHVMYRRTRRGWHVIITVNETLAPVVIVATQAIVGSDWQRENFNLARAQVLHELPRTWRAARRWNALYTAHTHL